MIINDKKKVIKNLWLYKSLLFKFVMFSTESDDTELIEIVKLLNIKNRYRRIYNIINTTCDYIDDYYKDKNLCCFCDSICLCHKIKKIDYKNGCCRKCVYQSTDGCTTKNIACKLFYCSYVKDKNEIIKFEDIYYLKFFNFYQRYFLKNDYFSCIEDVTKDLYFGFFIGGFRVINRLLINIFFSKK